MDVSKQILDTFFDGDVERHAANLTLSDIVERERSKGIVCGPFERQWLLENAAPERVVRYLQLAKERPYIKGMPATTFAGVPDSLAGFPTAAFTARNTYTTEASMLGNTANGAPTQAMINQYCAIPANDARPSRWYEVMFGASYGITATPTIIFTPRWGSSTTIGTNITLGASPTMTTVASPTQFFGHFVFGIRTAPPEATAGTGIGHGIVVLGNSATTPYGITGVLGGTLATIDTTGSGTAGCGIQFGVTWGTSSASNTYTPQWYTLTGRG